VPTVLLLPLCQAIVALTLKTQKSLNAAAAATAAATTSSKDVTLLELVSRFFVFLCFWPYL
jgi:hypothetical protein